VIAVAVIVWNQRHLRAYAQQFGVVRRQLAATAGGEVVVVHLQQACADRATSRSSMVTWGKVKIWLPSPFSKLLLRGQRNDEVSWMQK
jgi:hypothetical protein